MWHQRSDVKCKLLPVGGARAVVMATLRFCRPRAVHCGSRLVRAKARDQRISVSCLTNAERSGPLAVALSVPLLVFFAITNPNQFYNGRYCCWGCVSITSISVVYLLKKKSILEEKWWKKRDIFFSFPLEENDAGFVCMECARLLRQKWLKKSGEECNIGVENVLFVEEKRGSVNVTLGDVRYWWNGF